MRKHFDLPFEVKEIDAKGQFSGIASIYGAIDLGGDVVERGAFSKSLAENPTVPILWQHDQREVIGEGKLHSTKQGLNITGQLDIDIDATAQRAHAKMMRGRVKGLSIGYQSIKDEIKNGIRHLQEVKLWEVSVVTFPMLPGAQVTSVKSAEDVDEFLAQFAAELAEFKAALTGELRTKFLSLIGEAGLLATSTPSEPTQPAADFGPLVKLLADRKEIRWN